MEDNNETQEIQNLCSEAESNAEALVAPLKRTVEELDKLYDSIKDDPDRENRVKELCDEIDELVLNLKEMVNASSLEINQVLESGSVDEKNEDNNCEEKEDDKAEK